MCFRNQNAVLTRSPSLVRLIMTPTLTLSLMKTSINNAFHCSVCLHTKPKWQTCPLSGFLPCLCNTYRPPVAGGTPVRRGSTGKGVFFRYMKWWEIQQLKYYKRVREICHFRLLKSQKG